MKLENCSKSIVDKEFHKFLKENNVYDKYYEYRKATKMSLNGFESYEGYFMDAFDWKQDTNGDSQFWARLSNLWDYKLEEEYKESNEILNLI